MDTTVTLTPEQKIAVDQGESVPCVIDGKACVVVLKDVYEKSLRILDLSKMAKGEAFQNIDQIWGEDPALDLYQEFKR